MKASLRTTLIASCLLVACMIASAFTLHHLDQTRTTSTLEDALYIPSPKVLKRASLGYDGLLADIYWTRVVQYFGNRHHEGAHHYDLLAPLLEITTTLDPHLTVAYEFGANFLAPPPPKGAGLPERAIELAKFGIRNNPSDWKLYYSLGFIYYMELKDYAKAAQAFADGSKIPNAHPFLKVMAAQMAQHGGELPMARMLWTTTYQSTQDPYIRANARAHLRALQVDEDVTILEKLISTYQQRTGKLPSTFNELEAVGLISGIPLDPLGQTYKITSDGHVEVRDPDNLPFIEKGIPPGYVPSLPKFLPSDISS